MNVSQHNRLWMVDSKQDEALNGGHAWMQGPRWEQHCEGCGRPRLGLYPAPLEFVSQLRQRATISTGDGLLEIYKRRFFDMIASHALGIIPGEVRLEHGRILRDSVTVHFPPFMELNFRGGHGTRPGAYGVCRICKRPKASRALMDKPWYVLRSQIPLGDVFATNEDVLLITDSLRSQLDFSPFPDLVLRPIMVLDEPIVPVSKLGDAVPGAGSASEAEGQ